jgi:CBS domain-containing protein
MSMRILHNLQEDIKEREVVSVTPDTSVYEALQVMDEHNIGSVLVIEGDELAGIYTERDYARKGELQGRSAKETSVHAVMTPADQIISVTPLASLYDCASLMLNNKIRHVVFMDGGKVVGIISERDIIAGLHEDISRVVMDYFGFDLTRT